MNIVSHQEWKLTDNHVSPGSDVGFWFKYWQLIKQKSLCNYSCYTQDVSSDVHFADDDILN